jgi:putative acyl-CoA dehydrogenase
VVTPAAKFWICKRAPALAAEAMEVLGGSGYVEDCALPRIYRELPVNSIWEGSGNVMCLDVLRALDRTPGAADVLAQEVSEDAPQDARLDAFVTGLLRRLAGRDHNDESQARVLTRDLVLALQATLLWRHSPPMMADAFCASRLRGDGGAVFGMLPEATQARAMVDRAAPIVR